MFYSGANAWRCTDKTINVFNHVGESSKGTNSHPLFTGAGVGANLSWFPSIEISVQFLYSVKIQSTRCARSMISAIHKSTGHM